MVFGEFVEMANNTLGNEARFTESTLGDSVGFNGNNIAGGGTVTQLTLGEGTQCNDNVVAAGGTIQAITTPDTGSFQRNTIINSVTLSNKTFDTGVVFDGNTIGVTMDETETITESIEGKRAEPGYSDIPATIEIDGVTTLDITAAKAQYCGIINVTSPNTTETIDQIDNPPTAFPFTIRPDAGLVLTITGTAYSGIASGQIALKATDYTLDGDKGEYIVLEIDPLGTGCLVEKLVVNGLI